MKYLSLFSGIGGFELGIQKAYEEIKNNKRTMQITSSNGHQPDSNSRMGREQEQWGVCIGYSEKRWLVLLS